VIRDVVDSSFDNQVIFKLATIETKVGSISDNLLAAVHRLEDKIAETHALQVASVTKVEAKVQALEVQVKALENYRDKLAAKVGGVVSVIAVFWMLFGKALEAQVAGFFS